MNLTSHGNYDAFISKYDRYGNYVWAIDIGGSANDYGSRLKVDNLGNVFVIGSYSSTNADFNPGPDTMLMSTNGLSDIFIAAYNSNGQYLWAQGIGGPRDDYGNAIVIDANKNIYITGGFKDSVNFNPGGNYKLYSTALNTAYTNLYYARYDSSGNFNWAKALVTGAQSLYTTINNIPYYTYEGADIGGNDLTIDNSGKLILTGYSYFINTTPQFNLTGNYSQYRLLLLKADTTSGQTSWILRSTSHFTAQFSPAPDARGNSITTDASGNIYFTGSFKNCFLFSYGCLNFCLDVFSPTQALSKSIIVGKLSPNGTNTWLKVIAGTSDDVGTSIAYKGGYLYISGTCSSSTINVNSAGNINTSSYSLPAYNVTGHGGNDAFIGKLRPDSGSVVWAKTIGGAGNDQGIQLIVQDTAHILLAGLYSGSNINFNLDSNSAAYNLSTSGTNAFVARYGTCDGPAVSGGSVSMTQSVSGPTTFVNTCQNLAVVTPSGNAPVSGNVTVKVVVDTVRMYNNELLAARHYDIEPASNAATATATLTLYWKQSDFDDYNNASIDSLNYNQVSYGLLPTEPADSGNYTSLKIRQYHGLGTRPGNYSGWSGSGPANVLIDPGWDPYTNPTVVHYDSALQAWAVTFDITGFSGFYATTSTRQASLPLPIVLKTFTATAAANSTVDLAWTVTDQSGITTYTLERSHDGRSFLPLHSFAVRPAGQYYWKDEQPFAGDNYYRLRIRTNTGSESLSDVQRVSLKGDSYTQVYPSPAKDYLILESNNAGLDGSSYSIADLRGRIQAKGIIDQLPKHIDLNKLSEGIYILRLQNGCSFRITKL